MKSPFPGMDPFIEARGLWADFHDNLIVEMQRALNELLPDRYEALLGERTFIDLVDPTEGTATGHVVKPDVRIDGPGNGDASAGTAWQSEGVLATSVLMHPELAVEERETFVEIRQAGSEEHVVTCIELLSPTNKRPGSPGWAEYERKRQLMFRGQANFVEIDLLRGGRRRPMREPWPASPYYLLVMWKDQAPECRVWPVQATEPLPPVPIPLVRPDPDLEFQLQPCIDAVLARSRYERRMKYVEPIHPPLSHAEAALLPQSN
jgi:hypothetical protein